MEFGDHLSIESEVRNIIINVDKSLHTVGDFLLQGHFRNKSEHNSTSTHIIFEGVMFNRLVANKKRYHSTAITYNLKKCYYPLRPSGLW